MVSTRGALPGEAAEDGAGEAGLAGQRFGDQVLGDEVGAQRADPLLVCCAGAARGVQAVQPSCGAAAHSRVGEVVNSGQQAADISPYAPTRLPNVTARSRTAGLRVS